MSRHVISFDTVRRIGLALADVEESTAYGSPCLKVKGRMFACMAINKSAEPESLMVRLPLDQRDALVAEEPSVYYLTPHYSPYPCVLIRLRCVHRDALADLVRASWRFASQEKPRRRSPRPGARTRRA